LLFLTLSLALAFLEGGALATRHEYSLFALEVPDNDIAAARRPA
jgi:hypothetical protein